MILWLVMDKPVASEVTWGNINPWLGSNGSYKHWEEKIKIPQPQSILDKKCILRDQEQQDGLSQQTGVVKLT